MAKQTAELASILRHRITLQQPLHSIGAGGEAVEEWEDVAEIWAAIEPLQGSEAFLGEQITAEKRNKITIRYRAEVNTHLRILFKSRVFTIRSVICPDEAQERLVIIAEESL